MTDFTQIDEAFDNLSAEFEYDWLATVFIDPAILNTTASMRSMIISGPSGAGKSALRLILAQRSIGPDGPERLAVEWRFAPSFEPLHGSRLVQAYAGQVLAACAEALLHAIGHWPDRYLSVHGWVQEATLDFVRSALGAAFGRTAARLERDCPPEGVALLRSFQQVVAHPPALHHVPDAIIELSSIVQELGMAGVWVLVDRLEPWIGADADQVGEAFRTMLETLTLFETPGFVFKLFMPPELETRLAGVSGVGRRRLDIYHLTWSEDELAAVVNARIRAALGSNIVTLDTLCDSPLLSERLHRYGGRTPRGWLESLRPFVEACRSGDVEMPLSADVCTSIHRKHPPLLRVDLRTDQVYLGEQELTDLQPTTRRLLHYLYANRDRVVSRSELHYCGQRNLPAVPPGAEEGWDGSPEWSAKLDTALWRLRKQVEPDSQSPVYVLTAPTGIRLQNVR